MTHGTRISQTCCSTGQVVFCLAIGFVVGAGIAKGQRKKNKRTQPLTVVKF